MIDDPYLEFGTLIRLDGVVWEQEPQKRGGSSYCASHLEG